MALPTTSKKVFTTLHYQAGATLHRAKLHELTTTEIGNLTTPVAGELAYGGDTHLKMYDGSAWQNIHRTGVALSTGSTFTSTLADGTAPFAITSTSVVNNLNVDMVDGCHASTSATASAIPIYGTGGILKVGTPVADDDASSKGYVDNAVQGLDHKESVKYTTTDNITLSGLSAQSNLDGTPIAGDRILVKNQDTASENGIYIAASGAWSRATDANFSSSLITGDNSTFTSGLGDWVDASGTVAAVTHDASADKLNITGVSLSDRGKARLQATGLTVGKTYRFEFTATGSNNEAYRLDEAGFGGKSYSPLDEWGSSANPGDGTHVVEFVALTTNLFVELEEAAAATLVIDDVSLKEFDLGEGSFAFVEQGDTKANTSWVKTNATDWAQFSGAGQIDVTSNGSAAAPLTKSGDTINFAYNTTRFDLNSNALDIKDGGIDGDQLADDAVDASKLKDTAAFTMAGLEINAASGGRYATLNAASPNGGYLTLETNEVAYADIGSYLGQTGTAGTSATDLLITARGANNIAFRTNYLDRLRIASNGKIGIGADATSPSGTLHVSTARYTGNLVTGDNADFSVSDEAAATGTKYLWSGYGTNTLAITSEQLVVAYVDHTGGAYSYMQSTNAGRKYRISIDAKYSGGSSAPLIRYYNGTSIVNLGTLTTSIATYTDTFTRGTDAPYWAMAMSGDAGQTVTIDNVKVEEDCLAAGASDLGNDLVVNGNTATGINILARIQENAGLYFGDSIDADHSAIQSYRYTNTGATNGNSEIHFGASVGGTRNNVMSLYGSDKSVKIERGLGVGTVAGNNALFVQLDTINEWAGCVVHTSANSGYGLLVKGGNASTNLALEVRDAANTNLFTIKGDGNASFPNGNVAIGGTSASEKLHVHAGDIMLDSGRGIRIPSANSQIVLSLPDGLKFYTGENDYRLQIDAEGTQDHKANSIVNSATVQGLQDGACYDFDGTSGIVGGNAAGNSGTAPFNAFTSANVTMTLAAWIKPSSTSNMGIMSIGHIYLSLVIKGGYLELRSYNSGGAITTTATHAISANEWCHVAAVLTGGNVTLYKNGIAATAVSAANEAIPSDGDYLRLGYGYDQSNYVYFDGSIRDAKVFPSVLTAGDVRKLYSGENPKKNLNVELLTNGDFSSALGSEWDDRSQGTLSISSGQLLITPNSGGSYAGAQQSFATPNAAYYLLSVERGTTTGASWVQVGTASGTSATSYNIVNDHSSTLGIHRYVFKATSNPTYITLQTSSSANGTAKFDNVSITEVGTLVDFNPRSASSTKWYNQAIPSLYHGTLQGGVTLSAGSTDYEVGAGEDRAFRFGDLAVYRNSDTAGRLQLGHYANRLSDTSYALQIHDTGELRLNAKTGQHIFFNQGDSAVARIEADGDFFIASGKKLGVGATPVEDLTVGGQNDPNIQLYSNRQGISAGTDLGNLIWSAWSSEGSTTRRDVVKIQALAEGTWVAGPETQSAALAFYTRSSPSVFSERMRLTSEGDLQLKSATYNKLRFWRTDETIAAGDVLGAIYASGTDSNTGSAPFDGAKIEFVAETSGWDTSTANYWPTRIDFYTQRAIGSSTLTSPRLTIDSLGDVGISTQTPQGKLDVKGSIRGEADSDTVLLIHSDTTSGNTSFVDSSPNGYAITRVGNTYHRTNNTGTWDTTGDRRFGNTAIYFDGDGDYLTAPYTSYFNFGTGDFTIDLWVKPVDANVWSEVISHGWVTNDDGFVIGIDYGGTDKLQFIYTTDGSTDIPCGVCPTAISTSAWTHVAVVRSGNGSATSTIKTYINGVEEASHTAGTNSLNVCTDNLAIGTRLSSPTSYEYQGYMDEIRISKTARWTSNFTPPARPYSTVNDEFFNDLSSISKTGINLGDNNKIRLGTGSDFELFYDGTDALIQNQSGGQVIVKAKTNFFVQTNSSTGGSTNGLLCDSSGNTKVYGKLGVGGDPDTETLLVTGSNAELRVHSTDENANQSLISIGSDVHNTNTKDSWMRFYGSASVHDRTWSIGTTPGSPPNGGFVFNYLATRATSPSGGTRVLSLDGPNNRVGIGTEAPGARLEILDDAPPTSGDLAYSLIIKDDAAVAAGRGGGISFQARYTDTPNYSAYAGIQGQRENATASNSAGGLALFSRAAGGDLAAQLKIKSDGTQDHYANRIVNSQTVNDLHRTAEPSLRFGAATTDCVSITSSQITGSSDWSYSAWVKPNLSSIGSWGAIYAHAAYTNLWIGININGYVRVHAGSSASGDTAAGTIIDNQWNHIVVTADVSANSLEIYTNGVHRKTATNLDLDNITASAAKIGVLSTSTNPFNGEIKDVRIHNRALDADAGEIAALYNGESTPFKYADSAGDVTPDTANSDASVWTKNPNATLTYDSDHMEVSNTTAAHGAFLTPATMGITPTEGKRYRISAYIKNGTVSGVSVGLQAWPLTGDALVYHTTTSSFVLVSTEFTMGATAFSEVGVWPNSNLGGDNVEFKDFKFEEVGEVAAYTPRSINDKWYDTTSNANHGTIIGATAVGDNDHRGVQKIRGYAAGDGLLIDNTDHDRQINFARNGVTTARIKVTEPNASGTSDFKFYTSTAANSLLDLTPLTLTDTGEVKATSGTSGNLIQVARVHNQTITGDNSSANFTILHNLGTTSITVSVREQTSYQHVECAVATMDGNSANSTNNCRVSFATAPGTGVKYDVTVIG